jgi:hypothetical protein
VLLGCVRVKYISLPPFELLLLCGCALEDRELSPCFIYMCAYFSRLVMSRYCVLSRILLSKFAFLFAHPRRPGFLLKRFPYSLVFLPVDFKIAFSLNKAFLRFSIVFGYKSKIIYFLLNQ